MNKFDRPWGNVSGRARDRSEPRRMCDRLPPALRSFTTQSTAKGIGMRETILELILRLAAFFAVESLLMLECPGRLDKAKESECPGKCFVFIPKSQKRQHAKPSRNY